MGWRAVLAAGLGSPALRQARMPAATDLKSNRQKWFAGLRGQEIDLASRAVGAA